MPCVPNARLWLGYERVSQLEVLITQAERVAASYTSQKKLLFCGVYQDPDLCIHSVIFHPSSLCSSLCFYLHPFASTSIPLLQPPSLCFYLHLFASISIPLLLPPPLCFNLHPFASTSIPLLQPPSLCFYLHPFASTSIPGISS